MKKNTFTLSAIRITVLSFMLGIGIFITSSASAATITYNPTTGNWTDANWTPQAPVAGDNIVIPAGAVVTLSTDAGININSLSVLGTLNITSSGVLSVRQTVTTNPLVSVGGGVISNAGTFSIFQTLANSNTAIKFVNGTDADAKFANTGTLNIDMMASTIASSSTNCINLAQTTATRTCRFTLGGILNFAVPDGTRFFELSSGTNGVIDGTTVFGSTLNYKNWRLIHMGNSGTLTLAGNIEFYSGYTNATNGTISMSISATNSAVGNLVNSGTLKIHGGPTVVAYGIYLNPQYATAAPLTSGTANFTNQGTLLIDGNFPLGTILLNGSTGTSASFNNSLGAIAKLTNSGTGASAVPLKASATASTIVNNAGTLNLSGTALDATINTTKNTYTNTGTVNFNVSTEVGKVIGFNGKIYAIGNDIYVNLVSDASSVLQLTDMTGRLIKQITVKGQNNVINAASLKGVFIARLITAEGIYSQKIIL
jgi:hypothetical protein